jgi:hypothetical protein
VNTAHLQRAPVVCSLDDAAAVQDPRPVAVLVTHAVLRLLRYRQSLKLLVQGPEGGREVVRVHQALPSGLIERHLAQIVPEHAVVALARDELIGGHVELVAAELGAGQGELQTPRHPPHLFLGTTSCGDVQTGCNDTDHVAVLVLQRVRVNEDRPAISRSDLALARLPRGHGLEDDAVRTSLRKAVGRFITVTADVVLGAAAEADVTVGPDDAHVRADVLEHDVSQAAENGVLLSLAGSHRVGGKVAGRHIVENAVDLRSAALRVEVRGRMVSHPFDRPVVQHDAVLDVDPLGQRGLVGRAERGAVVRMHHAADNEGAALQLLGRVADEIFHAARDERDPQSLIVGTRRVGDDGKVLAQEAIAILAGTQVGVGQALGDAKVVLTQLAPDGFHEARPSVLEYEVLRPAAHCLGDRFLTGTSRDHDRGHVGS